jgi:hypothetical protein
MHQLLARSRSVAIAGFFVLAGAVSGCGGGGGASAPPAAGPLAAPTAASGSGSPAPQASSASFSATQSQTLTASGSPIPVPLPSSSGYGGTMTLPTPTATMPANTSVTETLTNSGSRLPHGIAAANSGFLLYLTVQFSNSISIPVPSFLISLPPSAIAPEGSYYLAVYDPLNGYSNTEGFLPTNWQVAEGAVYLSGNTLYFPGPSSFPYNEYPLTFTANTPTYFAVFQIGGTLPSPAPSPQGSAAPFYLTPSNIQVPGIGAESDASVIDDSGCYCSYNAVVTNPNVATVSMTGTKGAAGIAVVGVNAGLTSILLTSSDGRSTIANVTVTQTNVSVQGTRK